MSRLRSSTGRSRRFGGQSFVVAGLVTTLAAGAAALGAPATKEGLIRQAQILGFDRTGVEAPVGLGFSARNGAFYVFGRSADPSADAEVVKFVPSEDRPSSDRGGPTRVPAVHRNSINVAFDARGDRLLLLAAGSQLLEIRADANGDLDLGTAIRHDVRELRLGDPQGMTVDPVSGALYILDRAGPRIVRAQPGTDGGFTHATISVVDLGSTALGELRGLAFDSSTGHVHVRGGAKLYELSQGGAVDAVRDLASQDLRDPQAMVFAPSGDLTDDARQESLYVADTSGIVELSLAPLAAAQASAFTSSLVATIDTSSAGGWDPQSPDPSALAYVPGTNRLLMSDGEVEETVGGITHWDGANVWSLTLGGSIVSTANISRAYPTGSNMTNEPTGAAYNTVTGQYYFADDGARRIYTVSVGADGVLGTSDDGKTYFLTNVSPNDNQDPEGVACDAAGQRLFVADGVNAEVYEYTLNGVLVGHFDVAAFGVLDPESVEFNPDTGTLFVISHRQAGPIIVETTTSGTLLQTIDASASGAYKPAGLAYAPASDGSGAMRLYIADRGIDNNDNPGIVDGRIYEMTAPASGPPNSPPEITSNGGGATASVSVEENTLAVTDVDATDLESSTLAYTIAGGLDSSRFTIVPETGVLTFTAAPDFENPVDSDDNNLYEVTVAAADGAGGVDTQAIAVLVNDVAEVNEAPVVTSDGGGPTASITTAENQTAVTDVDATDPENDTLGYAISGGVDAASFAIVPSTGVLTFTSPPDFETPADDGVNNVYDVEVTVSDGNGGNDTQAISVIVTDVGENLPPLYFSLRDAATLGALSVANEDIVFFDGTSFTLAFDGSDVGIGNLRIDGFARLDDDSFLFSFDADKSVPDIGPVDDSDVVRFDATSLGTITAGTFSMYFDGSDVGLSATAHDVDAIELLADGTLLLSTDGTATVAGATARDEDILAFVPTSLGDVTQGSFSLYFDGSHVGLGDTGEDVNALGIEASGNLVLSAPDVFAVTGVSGADEDAFVFTPSALGSTTAGTYAPTLYFDGSAYGLGANDVYSVELA